MGINILEVVHPLLFSESSHFRLFARYLRQLEDGLLFQTSLKFLAEVAESVFDDQPFSKSPLTLGDTVE